MTHLPLPTRLQVLEFIIPYELNMMQNPKNESHLRFLKKSHRQHLLEYKNITGKNFKVG